MEGTPVTDAAATSNGPARSRRRPAQLRSRRRVDAMLDVAAELVDELGPDQVTTTLIAERAGVSVGWIYDFFEDREAVFDAVVARSIEKLGPLVQRVHEEHVHDEWYPRLAAVIDALVDFYRTERGYRALWFSPHLSAAMLETMRADDELQVTRSLAQLADEGLELACPEPEVVMRLVVGIVDKGLDLAFRLHPSGDTSTIIETKRAVRAYLEGYIQPIARRPVRRSIR
jgi:AcrR family transcriptional regulator